MEKEYDYMVCVKCMTFNHALYINDTLIGFLMQKTSFPVVFCIIDDASTDGESRFLKEWANENLICESVDRLAYGEQIIGKAKNNNNLNFVILLLKENHYSKKKAKLPYISEWESSSKYFAYCEGDDYWTSPHKLQKQVVFLENHPSYSLCVHGFKRFLQNDGVFLPANRHYNEDISFSYETYIANLPTQPLTLMIRNSANPTPAERKKYKYFRDNHLYYYILQHGHGYYIAEEMGVYRITNNGVWTSLNIIEQRKMDLLCYAELYECHPDERIFRKNCIRLYSSYLFASRMNHLKPEQIGCKALGLTGKVEIVLRYYAARLHAMFKPEIKERVLIKK